MSQPLDFATLIEALGDAVFAVDRQGDFLLWNPGAERLLGYAACEVLGRPLELIIPEERRAAHGQGFQRVMQTGETRLGTSIIRVPAIHKDGRRLRLALTVGIVRATNGRIEAIGAVLREDVPS